MRVLIELMRTGLLAALATSGTFASAQNLLGMEELKALISGNTVHTENLSNGRTFYVYHGASGELELQREDAAVFSGIWSVRADGTHCVSFNDETCGRIEKNADGTYTRIINGAPAFKWLKITPGKGF
jgi:hypothetical protein